MKQSLASSYVQEDQLPSNEAATHIASARHSLSCLAEKLGGIHQWPELEDAITKLEIALSILTTETGGML